MTAPPPSEGPVVTPPPEWGAQALRSSAAALAVTALLVAGLVRVLPEFGGAGVRWGVSGAALWLCGCVAGLVTAQWFRSWALRLRDLPVTGALAAAIFLCAPHTTVHDAVSGAGSLMWGLALMPLIAWCSRLRPYRGPLPEWLRPLLKLLMVMTDAERPWWRRR